MSQLASAIEKAADAFAREIIAAVKAATLQELLAMQEGAIATGAKPRGRPPKARPGRKPGRPAKTAANKKRKINYPKCSVPGCGTNRYAKGNGMCGAHFKASKGGATA
jgi:hypothetical protein